MNKFHNETLSQIKKAVWQEQPYIAITLDSEIGFSMHGNKAKLEEAMRTAMNNSSEFRQIVRNALSAPRASEKVHFQSKFKSQTVQP